MNREQALSVLAKLKPQLQKQFGVSELALFGSAARDELREGSDIDVLVRFDSPAISSRYFGVQFAIEDALGMPVDLVTDRALRKELKPFVEKDRILV
ncbi:MAG: DNA polymerase subunit beta [Betaproteobacteria bacterium]|nr:MAG: DNA polymerase subunit beta [Betaproteobacteria bacterium]